MNTVEKREETMVVNRGPPGLVKGYLEDFTEADIIVNSAPKNMKLNSSGNVSAAILSRAGQGIQEECDNKFPNGLETGEIAITSGHRLPYSLVFHVSVQDMNHGRCHEEMASLIKKCLLEADGKQITRHNGMMTLAKTIAFPLLGTGPKNLPPDICCVFYRTILSFLLGPTKSLENVYIIVKPTDTHLIQVIKNMKPLDEFRKITHELCYPPSWSVTQNNLDIIELSNTDASYGIIMEEFLKEAPLNAKVIKIERLENRSLYRTYLEAKCKHNLIKKEKEMNLWFYCEPNSVNQLSTSGLTSNLMRDGRCGKGYYFCTSTQLADDLRTNRDNIRTMVYCSVGIGKPILGNQDHNVNNLPINCFSTVDNLFGPTMYAIFNEKLFYPNYLVTYEG